MTKKENLQTYYFVSDIHFGIESKEKELNKEQSFKKLCELILSDPGALFILGDLFDYWFEYKYVIQSNSIRILNSLIDLRDAGLDVYYVIGNHDFSHLGYLENELKFKVIEKDLDINLNGKRFYLAHGDGLNPEDYGYLLIKSILRKKTFQKLYSFVHPDIGIGLAKYMSSKSRKYTSNKKFEDIKWLQNFLSKKSSEGYDYIVLGHTHQLIETKINNSVYINLGSWFKKYSYGRFKEKFEILEIT